MEIITGPFGLEFLKVPAGKVMIGTDKGGWVHGSERPRHEVRLPDFLIMKKPLTKSQFERINGRESDDESPVDMIDLTQIKQVSTILGQHFDDEVRLPSQGEWEIARGEISLPCGFTELLADQATGNHRGAQMDGRPRIDDMAGPMKDHRVSQTCHPKRDGFYVRIATPGGRPLPKVGFRLVVSPKRDNEPTRVPFNADFAANIRTELLWIVILGIIPSFVIPVYRGFSSYALDGWPNLLLGGLCAGFVTGAIWRPKRKTWRLDDDGNLIGRNG